MKWFATIAAAVAFAVLAAAPAGAQSAGGGAQTQDTRAQSEPRRVRPKIRVRPVYPYRRYHSVYPVPYRYEYPGPNAKRECVARYVEEHRPSGTVVVPRMHCWWLRG